MHFAALVLLLGRALGTRSRLQRTVEYFSPCYYDWPLIQACASGDVALVEGLLAEGMIDPNTLGGEPLFMAVSHGRLEVVEALLRDRRVDASVGSNRALARAAELGNGPIFERLLVRGRIAFFRLDEAIRQARLHCSACLELLRAHYKWDVGEMFDVFASSTVSWL